MSKLEIEPAYINKVLERLTQNPTAQDMDFLVEAYTKFGYMEATATGDADLAEAERKYAEAEAFSEAKKSYEKAPAAFLEAQATLATRSIRLAEIKARTNARKISNAWRSVEQTINAVKFLGRFDSGINTSVTMRGRD